MLRKIEAIIMGVFLLAVLPFQCLYCAVIWHYANVREKQKVTLKYALDNAIEDLVFPFETIKNIWSEKD